jgi:uncharacterized protein (TIGR03118 family)
MRPLVTATAFAAAALTSLVLALAAAGAPPNPNLYTAHNLVSDQPGVADHVDAHLVNAWGLTSLATSPWWVADNGTDVSTLYAADGTAFPPPPAPMPLVVSVMNAPTGVVGNAGTGFTVGGAPARFIFSTEEGKILAWNSSLGTQAQVVADRDLGAIYKGLAIAGGWLYASDFHNGPNGRIDVFDSNFDYVPLPGGFVDSALPAGFAPFGIQEIGGNIFVTYAKQDAAREDDVQHQGFGFVDEYDTNGVLLRRIATRGQLNAPWGLALAPSNFGRFSGDLLVGNFGDGEINAYAPQSDGTYERVGDLRGAEHKPILIDGLWALQFGHGAANNGPTNTLFFTAGPDDESHGLFGKITTG